MIMRKSLIVAFALIILAFAISIYVYPQIPEKVASHWNAEGQPDGYMKKDVGLFLMPAVSLVLLFLFLVIPRIDPLKHNIEEFRGYYDGFVVLFIAFLLYIHLLTIFWNIGYRFDMGISLTPALGALFFYLGILTENAKMNWFIGIRTPWTLSNENVWNRTHMLGGKLFKASGIIAIAGLVFPEYSVLLLIAPVLLSSAYLVIYSYLEFQKEMRK